MGELTGKVEPSVPSTPATESAQKTKEQALADKPAAEPKNDTG